MMYTLILQDVWVGNESFCERMDYVRDCQVLNKTKGATKFKNALEATYLYLVLPSGMRKLPTQKTIAATTGSLDSLEWYRTIHFIGSF